MMAARSKQRLSHIGERGQARMVDVSGKIATERTAVAEAFVCLLPATLAMISEGTIAKGNALETARLAGIMAAKRTADLIPLCHPLLLTYVDVDVYCAAEEVRFVSKVSCAGQTGVEMEALMAVSIAALTLYDMIKAVDKGAVIQRIRLLEKFGGKSGLFRR